MDDKPKMLLCSPKEPGWTAAPGSVTGVCARCRREIWISVAGVSILLSTPGLEVMCLYCVPPRSAGKIEYMLHPEVAAEFARHTGAPPTPDMMEFVERIAEQFRD